MTNKHKYQLSWHCIECGVHGTVYFDDNVDIWLVMDKIAENHRTKSPTCRRWWSFLQTGDGTNAEKLQ